MNQIAANNRRIAKNTLMLYIRMAFTMGIGFFTTRELLLALGVEDYGLVNLIGGVVSMFAFLSGTMQTAASRFFNFELGRKDFIKLRQTFSLTLLIYVVLIIIIFSLSETVGLWFFKNKLAIPANRVNASFLFFQFTLFAFLFSVASVPYSALIISHEKMSVFARISVFENIGKLGIVYLLYLNWTDRLAIYGFLLLGISSLVFFSYVICCYAMYPESRISFYWDKTRFAELLSFSSWNLFGAMSGLFTNVFVNVLLNNYFGATVVAARSVALLASSGVSGFAQNFMAAVNPQLVKYYSSGSLYQAHNLALRASRFGFFLLFIIALPVLLKMDYIFNVWLKNVPAYAIFFGRLAIIQMLIDSISLPLMTLAQASGKIAFYQLIVGGMLWMNLPVVYIFISNGAPPDFVAFVAIGVSLICLFLRLKILNIIANFPIKTFFRDVVLRVLTLVVCAGSVSCLFLLMCGFYSELLQCAFVGISSVTITGIFIFLLGLSPEERVAGTLFIKAKVTNFFYSS